MKKTKKFLSIFAILFVAIFALSCCFFAACGSKDDDDNTTNDGTTQDDGTTGDDDGTSGGTTGDNEGGEAEGETPEHVHNLTMVEAKEATCTDAGNSAYYTCDGCDKIFKDEAGTEETTLEEVTIAALGHEYQSDDTTATCTEAGTSGKQTCSRCGDVIEGTVVPATGHDLVGTYSSETWTYECANDETESFTDISSMTETINTITLKATDEATLAAAGSWSEIADVSPIVEVTEKITITTSVYFSGNVSELVLKADIDVQGDTVLGINNTLTIDLNGHTIARTGNETAYYGTVQVGTGGGAYGCLTIKDSSEDGNGKITAQWYAVVVNGVTNEDGLVSTCTIESGELTATNGVGLSTNGTRPAVDLYIKGGKLTNGTNDTPAVFLPSGTLYMTGGELNGGSGIESRGGVAYISGGKITATGTPGTVTESTSNGPVAEGYAVAQTWNSSYPEVGKINISGGTFVDGSIYVSDANKDRLSITGGTFSEDPTGYLSEKYIAIEDNGDYRVVELVWSETYDLSGVDDDLKSSIESLNSGNPELSLDEDGVLTFRDNNNPAKSHFDTESNQFKTGGKTDSKLYFYVDLTEFEGYTVHISVIGRSTGSTEATIELRNGNYNGDNILNQGTSASDSEPITVEYAGIVGVGEKIYITFTASVYIQNIEIEITSA